MEQERTADRGPIRITAVGSTDVGRVREHNEDNLLVADLTSGERLEGGRLLTRELGGRGFILAVADGMGGSASGETASEMAVETLFENLRHKGIEEGRLTDADLNAALEECLKTANEMIHERSRRDPRHRGMGTTMTAVLALGDRLAIAQVGDSRAYLMRGGRLVQATKDQSLISRLIEEGALTPDEAEQHVGKNVILQALGVKEDLEVDSKTIEIRAGDILVLCSDGLSGMVGDREIEAVLAVEPDLSAAGSLLVARANEAGGQDNITVVLARFEGAGLRAPQGSLEEGREPGTAARSAPPETISARAKRGRAFMVAVAGALATALAVYLYFGGYRFFSDAPGRFFGGYRTADVTFEFPAPGALASLRPAGGGGEIAIEVAPDGTRGVARGLKPGEYLLSAELEHHEPLRDSAIVILRGAGVIEVPLVGRTGSLRLVPATPHVRVTLEKVDRKEWEPAYLSEEIVLSTAPRRVSGVAAGDLLIRVSRDGYRPAEPMRIVLPAGANDVTVALPELAPLSGWLELRGPPGAAVTVRYQDGDSLSALIPASGRMSGQVRAGDHVLEVRHPSYKPLTGPLGVREGSTTQLESLELEPLDGSLCVHGPYGGVLFLVRRLEKGTETVRIGLIGRDGVGRLESVPPGEYLLRLETPWDDPAELAVTVAPAREDTLEFVH